VLQYWEEQTKEEKGGMLLDVGDKCIKYYLENVKERDEL
jgi:hypothetical protein